MSERRRGRAADVGALAGLFLVQGASGQSLSTPRPPVFRAEIGIVVLQATVKNGHGELITNLERSAFTVYENGQAQPLTLFGRDEVPVSLGIAIDNSGSMRDKRPKVEAAALALVAASNPADEVFVLSFGDKPQLDVPFTSEQKLLESGIHRGDSIGGTALRDAVDMAETYLREHAAHARRALLVITDGNDNASHVTEAQIHDAAERGQTVVYAIGLLNDQDSGKAKRARRALDELTESTGGLVYYAESLEQVGAVALELARQIRSQYTIGFSPQNQARDGSYRKLRVVARGSERLVVRTREGYRAVGH